MPSPLRRRPRLALVGAGSAATRAHLPVLFAAEARGETELVGVCDRDAGRRAAVLAGRPAAQGFDDNTAMLDATTPDLLVIATPPSAHLDEISAAVGRGVHVLCEKPLGLQGGDVAVLRRLATDHPELGIITVAQYRHAAGWWAIARAAAGAVRAAEEFRLCVSVERPGTDPLSAGGWRSDPEREGGILGDHGVHYLSLLRELEPAITVTSCERRGPGGRETATIVLRLGANGSAVVDLSYAGERRANSILLERPRQCLEVRWDDSVLQMIHNGSAGPLRPTRSLSDRGYVNELYQPMYSTVLHELGNAAWRRDETRHTLDVAALLARARELAR